MIDTKQVDLFRLLWTKIIKIRLSALWASLRDLNASGNVVDLAEIAAIDTSGFNMFSVKSYSDKKRVLAFRRQFALDGLNKMSNGLLELNVDATEINQIIDDVHVLKRTKIKL